MRYINYYDNDTLSIFDKNTNKILANILLDKEDIPSFRKDRNKWMAYIGINYKLKTIGYFNTEKEAKEARKYYCENQ